MREHWVEIRLKVPDNTAYTAFTALRRLGVEVTRVERAKVVRYDVAGEEAALGAARSDETLFNPNLHELRARANVPMEGEVFLRSFDYAQDDKACIVWRLTGDDGAPASRAVLERACEALLCNSAIEEAALPA
jgi:phosphoribosylformylglycinamidine (FGAM) synthase PurS component